jgi:hypothetical protein
MSRSATRILYDNLMKALKALQDAGEAPKTGIQQDGFEHAQFVEGKTHTVGRDREGVWYVNKHL